MFLSMEGFDPIEMSSNNRQVMEQDPNNLYDATYSNIYKNVYVKYSGERIKYEIKELIEKTQLKEYEKNGILVDLGCGSGEHLAELGNSDISVRLVGVDKSSSMLKYAKKHDPKIYLRLIKDDISNENMFANNSVTHITCYQFVIYEVADRKKLIENAYKWLKPGGYFVVHLVDKDKFDPIPDLSAPFIGVNHQKYYKKRNNTARVHFSNYVYNSIFKSSPKSLETTLEEEIVYKNKPIIRKQTIKYTMPTVQEMVNEIGKSQFELVGSSNLDAVEHTYQYIFYFRKL